MLKVVVIPGLGKNRQRLVRFPGRDDIGILGVAGEEYRPDCRVDLFNLGKELRARHFGHLLIGNHEGHRVIVNEGERFLGEPRALVIAPTRELVMQIAADAKELGRHTGLKVVTLIGGMDYQKQLNHLQREVVDLVVATPGRLIDFMGRRDV